MKIVIAPDSYKESLDAMAVATCIENGFSQIFTDAEFIKLPLADGGEGTVDVLLQALKGEKKYSRVSGPLGTPVDAMWAVLEGGKTALIEIASASGLDLLSPEQRDPLRTTTFGTGELIKQALDLGVEKILLGLGGSATNDGGAGLLSALGAKLLDDSGREVSFGGAALQNLAGIDLSAVDPRCADVQCIVACDVDNPLCGEAGASAVFAAQKGADQQQLKLLDNALLNFANTAQQTLGINHRDTPGFGAAGGAPLGLSLAFNIQIQAGIEMVLDLLNADQVLENTDLLITGEGQMDNQTLQGKAPYGIAKRAKQKGVPVIAIAGSLGTDLDALYSNIDCIFGTVRSAQKLPQVFTEAESNLTRTARNIAAALLMGNTLSLK
ncbi:MAG: glycerate kinase [Psychromonas sp.]|nr:glycerate kinase [Psychromonas sp.]